MLSVNLMDGVTGVKTELIPIPELAALGVARVSIPVASIMVMHKALTDFFTRLARFAQRPTGGRDTAGSPVSGNTPLSSACLSTARIEREYLAGDGRRPTLDQEREPMGMTIAEKILARASSRASVASGRDRGCQS